MGKRTKPHVIQHLKDWWWLYGVGVTLCSAIVLWGGIPGRLAKAEEQIDDLKGWARELQGYTRANQQRMQQQTDAWPVAPAASPTSRRTGPIRMDSTERTCIDERTWEEIPCP